MNRGFARTIAVSLLTALLCPAGALAEPRVPVADLETRIDGRLFSVAVESHRPDPALPGHLRTETLKEIDRVSVDCVVAQQAVLDEEFAKPRMSPLLNRPELSHVAIQMGDLRGLARDSRKLARRENRRLEPGVDATNQYRLWVYPILKESLFGGLKCLTVSGEEIHQALRAKQDLEDEAERKKAELLELQRAVRGNAEKLLQTLSAPKGSGDARQASRSGRLNRAPAIVSQREDAVVSTDASIASGTASFRESGR